MVGCWWLLQVSLFALHLVKVYDGHLRKVVDATLPVVSPHRLPIFVTNSVNYSMWLILLSLAIVFFIHFSFTLLVSQIIFIGLIDFD